MEAGSTLPSVMRFVKTSTTVCASLCALSRHRMTHRGTLVAKRKRNKSGGWGIKVEINPTALDLLTPSSALSGAVTGTNATGADPGPPRHSSLCACACV